MQQCSPRAADSSPSSPPPQTIGKLARRRQRVRILLADLVLRDHALAPRLRQLRQRRQDLLPAMHPRHHQRRQIRLREIAVVVRLFLRPHRVGPALLRIPQPRLLHHAAAALRSRSICRSISYSSAARIKRKLFTFFTSALVPNSFAPLQPHAHIRIAAQRALFHVAVGHAGVEQNLLQPRQVLKRFVGSANIRLAHNLHQRRAAAVQIEIASASPNPKSRHAGSCPRPLPCAAA